MVTCTTIIIFEVIIPVLRVDLERFFFLRTEIGNGLLFANLPCNTVRTRIPFFSDGDGPEHDVRVGGSETCSRRTSLFTLCNLLLTSIV